MARNDGGGNGSFVFGLIVGAIGGAMAALLMTPKSGERLRQDLESRFAEAAGPVMDRAEPLIEQGKERATEIIDMAAERAQEVSGKIAAMEIPFDDDSEGVHAPPEPTPPTPASGSVAPSRTDTTTQ